MDSPLDNAPPAGSRPAQAAPQPGQTAAVRTAGPRLKAWPRLAMAAFLLLLFGIAIDHVFKEVAFDEVMAYLDNLPLWKVLEAVGLTALGYLVLTLYDVSAFRYLRISVPYRTVALGSFAGYAISNNVGFPVISGAGVRYRIYSEAGLSAATVAKVVVFSTTTFTLGITLTGAIGVLLGPGPVASLLAVPEWAVRAAAGTVLAGLVTVCVLSAVTHRPVKLWRWSFALPSGGIVLAQIVISSVEILLSGGALWLLLPETHGASFMEFLGIYCAALALALLSHIPGGLGVFESILLLGLSAQGSAGGVLAALLAFRFVYYVLPLGVAGVMLAIYEIRMHRGPVATALDRIAAKLGRRK